MWPAFWAGSQAYGLHQLVTEFMPRLSIGILTLNEEARIGTCIESAAFADEVIVVDSGSRDRTLEIAQAKGVAVYSYPDWQGFAVQRNRLLEHATGDWIFFLDADEVITPALAAEIQTVVAGNEPAVWEVGWEQMAYGQSLGRMRQGSRIPRLFPRQAIVAFEGVVHEGAKLAYTLPYHALQQRLPHYSRETIYFSLQKLAQYVQLGALKRHQQGQHGGVLRGMASGMANFIRLYFFHRGFLCGRAGFLHSFFVALECFFRYVALEVDAKYLDKPARRF